MDNTEVPITALFIIFIIGMIVLTFEAYGSETTITYHDGSTLVVPGTYVVSYWPKGFNDEPFTFTNNLIGEKDARWPLLDALCGGVDFSPRPPLCEAEPYWTVGPRYECDGFSPAPPGCD